MKTKFLITLILILSLSSCEKKVLEIVPVVQIQKDMSIPGAGDIKFFSFPSDRVGYAASDSSVIFKTTDAGSGWMPIELPGNRICRGMVFFDDSTGIILGGTTIYRTIDGGETWIQTHYGDFIGVTDDGLVVTSACGSSSCAIKVSEDMGQTFTTVGQITGIWDLRLARVQNNKVMLIDGFMDSDQIKGMDMNTGERFTEYLSLTWDQEAEDIFLSESDGLVVGRDGLMENPFGNGTYPWSDIEYSFYAADGHGDLMVCVGEKTILANVDVGEGARWTMILDEGGNSFSETFYNIRFREDGDFYISGSSGTLYRARI